MILLSPQSHVATTLIAPVSLITEEPTLTLHCHHVLDNNHHHIQYIIHYQPEHFNFKLNYIINIINILYLHDYNSANIYQYLDRILLQLQLNINIVSLL